MDKSWIQIKNRADPTYIRGIDSFIDWAFNQQGVNTVIRCPCRGCMNTEFKLRIEVREHLLKKGFAYSYRVWDLHGEAYVRPESPPHVADDELGGADDDDEDDIIEMIHDAYGFANVNETNSSSQHQEPNLHARNFYKLLQDADTELCWEIPGETRSGRNVKLKKKLARPGKSHPEIR